MSGSNSYTFNRLVLPSPHKHPGYKEVVIWELTFLPCKDWESTYFYSEIPNQIRTINKEQDKPLKGIKISGFETLDNPEKKAFVLKMLFCGQYQCITTTDFTILFEGEDEQTIQERQVAAREALLKKWGEESKASFASFISTWLQSCEREDLIYHYSPANNPLYLKNEFNFYRRLMGSLFLKELLEYFKSLSSDSFIKNSLKAKRFVYFEQASQDLKAELPPSFADDLQMLAEAARFPLNLKLPTYDYSSDQGHKVFKTLLELLKTAKTKGIDEIDLSGSKFSDQQLNQLLVWLNHSTDSNLEVCQLINLSGDDRPLLSDDISLPGDHIPLLSDDRPPLVKVEEACRRNFQGARCSSILSLLGAETRDTASGIEIESKEKRKPVEEKKEESEDKKEDSKKEEKKFEKVQERKTQAKEHEAPQRTLSNLLAQIQGPKGVKIQVQQEQQQQHQEQQQQQQQQEQQAQAQHEKKLEAPIQLDRLIGYERWRRYVWFEWQDQSHWGIYRGDTDGYKLTERDNSGNELLFDAQKWGEKEAGLKSFDDLQKHVVHSSGHSSRMSIWFDITLSSLRSANSLDGFTSEALDTVLRHFSLCQGGFDFKRLPPGFKLRDDQQQGRILDFDPFLPAQAHHAHPLTVQLTQVAADSQIDSACYFVQFIEGDHDRELIHKLMARHYCYKAAKSNHGLCECIGCTRNPEGKKKEPDEEELKADHDPFSELKRGHSKHEPKEWGELLASKTIYDRSSSSNLTEDVDQKLKEARKKLEEMSKEGIDSNDLKQILDERDEKSLSTKPLYEKGVSIRDRCIATFIRQVTGNKISEIKEDSNQDTLKSIASEMLALFDKNVQSSESLIKEIHHQWEVELKKHDRDLQEQRAACYRLLWGKQAKANQIHNRFPVLKHFSVRHLRLLLEVAAKFDFRPGYQDKPKPEVVEGLLNKLQKIRKSDDETFELLFRYVLQPSDNWLTTLFTSNSQSKALKGLCELSEQAKLGSAEATQKLKNWNWLLERHGKACGYADLDLLWRAFQYFDQKYLELTHLPMPMDLTRFHPDSVKDMRLFLGFLLDLLTRARDIHEQVNLLAEGGIAIDRTGACYASEHQGYRLVSTEMELAVPSNRMMKAEYALKYALKQKDEEKKKKDEEKKPQDEPKLVDYQVTRKMLIDEPKLIHFYRYLGQQDHAALSFSFYRSCAAAEAKETSTKSPADKKASQVLVLLAVTTAHRRAVALEEGEASQRLWKGLSSKVKKGGDSLTELLAWHRVESFAPLTFSEAMTLIGLWQVSSKEEQQQLRHDTKAMVNDPLYREPFLQVLREVYAPVQSATSAPPYFPLPLKDYLFGLSSFKKVFAEQKEQKEQKERKEDTDALRGDLSSLQWREKLCVFVSRITMGKRKNCDWTKITQNLEGLQRYSTTERYSVAKRLVMVLAGLQPGSLPLEELERLLNKALTEIPGLSPLDDKALLAWLHGQGEAYKNLVLPSSLSSNFVHPPFVAACIETLLNEFEQVTAKQRKHLTAILNHLWGSGLMHGPSIDQARNEAIVSQARKFLVALLNEKAVWRNRHDDLFAFLAELGQLPHYEFDFLKELLESLAALPFIDTELTAIKQLFATSQEEQIAGLFFLQRDFCEQVKVICECKTLTLKQREETLSLLRCYAAGHYHDIVGGEAPSLSDLIELLTWLAVSHPRALNDALIVLDQALKADSGAPFINTVKGLQALRLKLANQPKQPGHLDHVVVNEGKREVGGNDSQAERKPLDGSSSKFDKRGRVLADLLHGLADKKRDATLSLNILQQCAGNTSVAVIEILAANIGRKDKDEEVLSFLNLLEQLEKNNPQAFVLLTALSKHPPKLGIKKLSEALSSEGSLRPDEQVIEALQKLETDPHGAGGRPKEDPFDIKRVAENIARIADPGRHVDGQPRALLASQQQRLLEMVVTVETLGTESSLGVFKEAKDGRFVSASELADADLAKLMAEYRAQFKGGRLNEADKQALLLRAIALMRQAMYRGTKLFADDSQITAVCNAMVRHTDDNCFVQVDTGQGKTLVNAFNAACMWLLYGEVMVLTSDTGLSKRDLAKNLAFFELLGIPIADKIVTQEAKAEDYCQGGVTYSTFGGLELSRLNSCLKGGAEAKGLTEHRAVGLVIDEVDDAFFDDRTHYRHSVPQVEGAGQGESPLAVYYQAMEACFLDSKEYKRLHDKKSQVSEKQVFKALEAFLLKPPSAYQPSARQKAILNWLLRNNPDQLKTWFISLVRAQNMQKGVDFTEVEVTQTIDGEVRQLRRVCPYSTSARANPALQFSDGLQQFLQAKMQREIRIKKEKESKESKENKESKEGKVLEKAVEASDFLIQQESYVFLSSNNASVFNRKYARLVGATGTVGSAQEISRRLRHFPIRANLTPPHQEKKRVDHRPEYCSDEKYNQAILKQVQECAKKGEPILVLAENAQHLKEIAKLLKDEKGSGIEIQTLTGQEKPKQEKEIVKKAGDPGVVTIATPLGGRGFDAVLKNKNRGLNVIVTFPPANPRQAGQYKGRSGRRGQPGHTYFILDPKRLITKSGKKVIDLAKNPPYKGIDPLDILYAENEIWDHRSWQLDSYLGYVHDALMPLFLQINQEVLLLGSNNLRLRWQFIQTNLLRNLEQEWRDLKENLKAGSENHQQQLQDCQKQFLELACERWNRGLRQFRDCLDDFAYEKSREHDEEQQKKALAERQNQDRKMGGQDSADATAQISWEATELFQQIKKVENLLRIALEPIKLEEGLPKETALPDFDLPLLSDAYQETATPFINGFKMKHDLLIPGESKNNELENLKQQAIQYELADIALRLQKINGEREAEDKAQKSKTKEPGDVSGDPLAYLELLMPCLRTLIPVLVGTSTTQSLTPSTSTIQTALHQKDPGLAKKQLAKREYGRLLALVEWSKDQNLKQQFLEAIKDCPSLLRELPWYESSSEPLFLRAIEQSLRTLIRVSHKGLLTESTPENEKVHTLQRLLTSSFPSLGVKINAIKTGGQEVEVKGEVSQPTGGSWEPIIIEYQLNGQTFSISGYIDWKNANLTLSNGPNSAFQVRPAPEQKEAKELIPEEVSKDISKGKLLGWLLFALLCGLTGAALTVTGLLASLNLPLPGLAYWSLGGGVSWAVLSAPGFWVLVGIGAAYGFMAFLAVFALLKTVQLVVGAIQSKQQVSLISLSSSGVTSSAQFSKAEARPKNQLESIPHNKRLPESAATAPAPAPSSPSPSPSPSPSSSSSDT